MQPSDPQISCEKCNHISLEDLKGQTATYINHHLRKALVDSASGCMLCKLIEEACVHYLRRERVNINAATGHLGPVRLFCDRLKGQFFGNGAANPRSTSRDCIQFYPHHNL